MNTNRFLLHASAIVCLTASAQASAQYSLEAESLKLYGGTYSTDCANPAAPKLRMADTLNVEYNHKRMTGTNLMASASYLDPNPPPNYQMAMLGDVRRDARLIFVVYRDKIGLYIQLMADDPKVEAALTGVLGKAQFKAKYRDCDAASRAPLPKPVTQAAPVNPDSVVSWDFVRDKKFKNLYHKTLGSKVRLDWLATLEGPAPPVKVITVAGSEYRLLSVCKDHDCGDNNTVILYSPASKTVYGKIYESGKTTLIGKPSTEVAAELDRLWKSEWRQQQ
jgi:hypothetical protein